MAKLLKIAFVVLALAVILAAAEPPRRYRPQKQVVRRFQKQVRAPAQRTVVARKRILARQEEQPQEEAVTPYPTAEELKPEVPFEEGNKPDEVYGPPDEVYGPPDETYGPPELEAVPADQLPSEEAPEDFAPNPDAEEFPPQQPARLIVKKKKVTKKIIAGRLLQKVVAGKLAKQQKSQRLIVAPAAVAAPATVPLPFGIPVAASPFTQQYYVVNQQPFSYAAQYQSW